jgi:hypothetical protein
MSDFHIKCGGRLKFVEECSDGSTIYYCSKCKKNVRAWIFKSWKEFFGR